jgi:DNA repair protein RecO
MYYNLNAVVLGRTELREDDLLVTVYSEEKGKVILQARGAKKILSKLAGHLEPVSLSALNVTVGKHIDHLIGADIVKSYTKIKSNLEFTAYANYFIELTDKLTKENHRDTSVFNLLERSLDYLDQKADNLVIARICFGYKLLHLLGYNPMEKGILKDEIGNIIMSPIAGIIDSKPILSNLARLNKVLDNELEECLEQELKTKQFLKTLHV